MTESNVPMKWADRAMFQAEPQEAYDPATGVQPRVHLLWMTPDPLGAVAAMAMIYEGKVVRNLADLTDDQRRHYFDEMLKTHLHTPLENIKLHFLIEGVDRAFTHQLVRIRHASYAQESMRFAVPGDLIEATTLPPSLVGTQATTGLEEWDAYTPDQQKMRQTWDDCIREIDKAYHKLVNMGMPAEDARGLLPTAVATRIHISTDLNTLAHHAGNRLCTQAQFHWRSVFFQIVQQIRTYAHQAPVEVTQPGDAYKSYMPGTEHPDAWQFEYIANSSLFRPVCYQLAKCPFKASFDRACSIRERVEIRAKHGATDSSQWHKNFTYEASGHTLTSEGIQVEEWLADPAAARRSADG